jgi:hypothetical protein
MDGQNFIDLHAQVPDWLEECGAEGSGDTMAITLQISHHHEHAREKLFFTGFQ